MIRLMLVDDHPIVREGLAMMLGTTSDLEVVAQTGRGEDVLALCAEHQVDVMLLDLQMPGMSGLEVLRAVCREHPGLAVLVFSAYDTDEMVIEAVRSGARGYVLKGAPRGQLFEAIRLVAAGGSLVAASMMARALAPTPEVLSLTRREAQVLEPLARGWTNREIAQALGISERTVKFHVSALLVKLEVDNRTEAATQAVRLGLVEL